MNAAVLTEYGRFSWQNVAEPQITDQQVLVKVTYASICGSDQHIFRGEFHPRTQLPLIPGHEFAGEIIKIGAEVSGFKMGDRVAVDPIIWCEECAACKMGHHTACTQLKLLGVDMDGGFGQYVAAYEHQIFKIDRQIADPNPALIELYAIGCHANNRAATKKDDILAIWGAGKVGHSICQVARTITDNTIFLIDILDQRLEIAAKNYPNTVTINARKQDPVKEIQTYTANRGVDIAFEAIGHFQEIAEHPNPVQECIRSIRGAGTVCLLGLSGEASDIVFKELIWREGKIVTSRNSHGEFEQAISLLNQGKLKPDSMVSQIYPMAEAQMAFEALENNPGDYLKIILSFED